MITGMQNQSIIGGMDQPSGFTQEMITIGPGYVEMQFQGTAFPDGEMTPDLAGQMQQQMFAEMQMAQNMANAIFQSMGPGDSQNDLSQNIQGFFQEVQFMENELIGQDGTIRGDNNILPVIEDQAQSVQIKKIEDYEQSIAKKNDELYDKAQKTQSIQIKKFETEIQPQGQPKQDDIKEIQNQISPQERENDQTIVNKTFIKNQTQSIQNESLKPIQEKNINLRKNEQGSKYLLSSIIVVIILMIIIGSYYAFSKRQQNSMNNQYMTIENDD